MPETDSPYMTRKECALVHYSTNDKLDNVGKKVEENRKSVDKLSKILLGNGEEGLIMKFNRLTWRNQLIDKGLTMVVGILSTIITLIITGVLKL